MRKRVFLGGLVLSVLSGCASTYTISTVDNITTSPNNGLVVVKTDRQIGGEGQVKSAIQRLYTCTEEKASSLRCQRMQIRFEE